MRPLARVPRRLLFRFGFRSGFGSGWPLLLPGTMLDPAGGLRGRASTAVAPRWTPGPPFFCSKPDTNQSSTESSRDVSRHSRTAARAHRAGRRGPRLRARRRGVRRERPRLAAACVDTSGGRRPRADRALRRGLARARSAASTPRRSSKPPLHARGLVAGPRSRARPREGFRGGLRSRGEARDAPAARRPPPLPRRADRLRGGPGAGSRWTASRSRSRSRRSRRRSGLSVHAARTSRRPPVRAATSGAERSPMRRRVRLLPSPRRPDDPLKREIDQIAKDKGIDRKVIIGRARGGDAARPRSKKYGQETRDRGALQRRDRRGRALRVPRGRRGDHRPRHADR